MIIRGEIWGAKLHKTEGSVQYGTRPVIIIQCEIGNVMSPNVTVIPLTRAVKTRIQTHVDVTRSRSNGLAEDSIALVEGITTISKTQLINKIGVVNKSIINDIEKKLLIQLGIGGIRNVS